MTAPNFDIARAAEVLVDAAFMTDAQAADRHGLSRRTVLNYRARIDPRKGEWTPELAQLFALKLKEAKEVEGWAYNLTVTIRKAMSAVCECCDKMDKRNPNALTALTGSLQVLIDAELTLRVVDARLAGQNRSDGDQAG